MVTVGPLSSVMKLLAQELVKLALETTRAGLDSGFHRSRVYGRSTDVRSVHA